MAGRYFRFDWNDQPWDVATHAWHRSLFPEHAFIAAVGGICVDMEWLGLIGRGRWAWECPRQEETKVKSWPCLDGLIIPVGASVRLKRIGTPKIILVVVVECDIYIYI